MVARSKQAWRFDRPNAYFLEWRSSEGPAAYRFPKSRAEYLVGRLNRLWCKRGDYLHNSNFSAAEAHYRMVHLKVGGCQDERIFY